MTTIAPTIHAFDLTRAMGREPFKVKDLSLAEFGRNEIRLAEFEMPGLMALRAEYGKAKPLKGGQIGRLFSFHDQKIKARINFVQQLADGRFAL